MAKMKIQFKGPDEIGNAVSELCEPVAKQLLAAGTKGDELGDCPAYQRELDKWHDRYFKYGDYGCVEFTINADGTIQGRLVPLEEWD